MSIRTIDQGSHGRSQNPPPEHDLAQMKEADVQLVYAQTHQEPSVSMVLHGPARPDMVFDMVEGPSRTGSAPVVAPVSAQAAGTVSQAGPIAIPESAIRALEAQVPSAGGPILSLIYRHSDAKIQVSGDAEDVARGTAVFRKQPPRWAVAPAQPGTGSEKAGKVVDSSST